MLLEIIVYQLTPISKSPFLDNTMDLTLRLISWPRENIDDECMGEPAEYVNMVNKIMRVVCTKSIVIGPGEAVELGSGCCRGRRQLQKIPDFNTVWRGIYAEDRASEIVSRLIVLIQSSNTETDITPKNDGLALESGYGYERVMVSRSGNKQRRRRK
jgi:hypothetical protein